MSYYAWYPESNAHFFQAMPPNYYPYFGKRPMMVQSMFSKKKVPSGQPRPEISVLPRSIGPIYHPNENDVLCGRGGRINSHVGNIRFRKMVAIRKTDYIGKSTKKFEKAHIASNIVQQIRAMNPPGRFLKEDPDGAWFDIGDHKAIKKVGQALREDAPDVRDEMDGNVKKIDSDEKANMSMEQKQNENDATKTVSSYQESSEPITLTIRCASILEAPAPLPNFPTTSKIGTFAGAGGKNTSAAVAAALEGSGELAFGRVFYPPPTVDDMEVSTGKNGSLISGLSTPSQPSSFLLDQRQQSHKQNAYSGDFMCKAKMEAPIRAPSSLASLSINSGSLSFPASLLSDLSECFIAMDISES